MNWATWDQAAIASTLSVVAWLVLRRLRSSRFAQAVQPAFLEFALVAGLYSVWRIARELPFTHEAGAIDRARQLDKLQQALHLPTEISLQHFVIGHDWLARFANDYYAAAHVPGLIIFLVWLYVRHRDRYPHWRNGLAAVTAGCLLIRFIRVAPPRFIPELDFVDLTTRYGLGVYGPAGTGVSDQFAAMPSIHVGWAAVVALGIFVSTTSRWRWLFVLHLPITILVVAATGHHWWLDGVAAVAILWVGLVIDTAVRRTTVRRRRAPVDVLDRDPTDESSSTSCR